ncbi:MAG: N-acetyl-gamma-glutamyl-phosphate reductase [Myxococcales bacterium]|nr:N-acetyl-gamma-glutamyl-phosphate reductase [Myxococcales bacterium]
MASPVRVALVGASGYTGLEALRLLRRHPAVQLTALYADKSAGRAMAESAPAFTGIDLPPIERFDADAAAAAAEFAFLALPHGTAQTATAALLERGVRVIDLSADHRFDDPAFYAAIYGAHAHPESLARTVYGLPEHNRAAIRSAALIGCPGCYPTSVILASGPALFAGLLDRAEVIADCKSGVSGAGRSPSAGTHFPETSEGLHAYKTLAHRHAPEMSRALRGARVAFVPHLVPINRGILSTVYLRLRAGVDADEVRAVYTKAYADEPFTHLLPAGAHPDPRHVRGTNHCHLGLFVDGDLLVVQSAIDNLGKGAAGQAVQCFNLMADRPEVCGLTDTAVFP